MKISPTMLDSFETTLQMQPTGYMVHWKVRHFLSTHLHQTYKMLVDIPIQFCNAYTRKEREVKHIKHLKELTGPDVTAPGADTGLGCTSFHGFKSCNP